MTTYGTFPVTGHRVGNDSASIVIGGVGEFSFLDQTSPHVLHNSNVSDYVRFSVAGLDRYDALNGVVTGKWDMSTSLGLYSLNWQLLQCQLTNVMTTGGSLTFDNETSIPGTFQATVAPVPLPSIAWLFGAGLGALRIASPTRLRSKSA